MKPVQAANQAMKWIIDGTDPIEEKSRIAREKREQAQEKIENMRPYAKKLLNVIADIAATHRMAHPLLTHSTEVKKVF